MAYGLSTMPECEIASSRHSSGGTRNDKEGGDKETRGQGDMEIGRKGETYSDRSIVHSGLAVSFRLTSEFAVSSRSSAMGEDLQYHLDHRSRFANKPNGLEREKRNREKEKGR